MGHDIRPQHRPYGGLRLRRRVLRRTELLYRCRRQPQRQRGPDVERIGVDGGDGPHPYGRGQPLQGQLLQRDVVLVPFDRGSPNTPQALTFDGQTWTEATTTPNPPSSTGSYYAAVDCLTDWACIAVGSVQMASTFLPLEAMAPIARSGYRFVASDGGIFQLPGRAAVAGRRSSARWAASTSTPRSWAWRPCRPGTATTWWPPTVGSSTSARPGSTVRRGPSISTSRSSAWR